MATSLLINGQPFESRSHPETPLLWVLRDELGLTGTKFGCGVAACGSCTVQVDGEAQRSCQLSVGAVTGAITTIEGAAKDPVLPAVQQAWIDHQVAQCGYCQAGQQMQAASLLRASPAPTDADIDTAMNGNVCRCGTYPRIRAAIHSAGAALAGEG